MLAIADRLLGAWHSYVAPHLKKNDIPREAHSLNGHNKNWFCFLNSTSFDSPILRARTLPASGNLYIFGTPPLPLSRDPYEIARTLTIIADRATDIIKKGKLDETQDLNFYGSSIGCTLATYLANKFKKPGELVLTAPGARLPECIRDSISTSRGFRQAERSCHNFERYLSALRQFSPIENLQFLHSNLDIKIHLARYDKIIPYRSGLELVEAMQKRGLRTDTEVYPYRDHVSLLTFPPRIS